MIITSNLDTCFISALRVFHSDHYLNTFGNEKMKVLTTIFAKRDSSLNQLKFNTARSIPNYFIRED